jgi:hypothetical protein
MSRREFSSSNARVVSTQGTGSKTSGARQVGRIRPRRDARTFHARRYVARISPAAHFFLANINARGPGQALDAEARWFVEETRAESRGDSGTNAGCD